MHFGLIYPLLSVVVNIELFKASLPGLVWKVTMLKRRAGCASSEERDSGSEGYQGAGNE